ncbi:MAG: DUF1360 domain-containing protein [candidate division NC10 bacterium]|nr:DUF1360 domain-containing protein [candidate division NC10 bacterium]
MSAWLRFVLAVLATWRITHLLANEDGPAELLARFRERLGGGLAGRLMDCFHCLSFWVAAPLAFFVSGNPLELLLTWLALSGGACLLERFGQEPIALQPMSHITEGETNDGMLRSEASSLQERSLADDTAGRHAPRTR